MAELRSETYSDEYVKAIEENLNWHAAILSVLLQEAGGAVEIKADDLLAVNLTTAQAVITFDSERNVYLVEGVSVDES